MPSTQELMDQLESTDPQERRYALQDLGDLRDPSAIEAIVRYLGDDDTSVAEASVEALQNMKDSNVLTWTLPILESESVDLRNRAMEILESYVAASSKTILEFCAQSANPDVQKFGLDIIINANNRDEQSIRDLFPIIQKLAQDKNTNVAAAALELMGVTRDLRVLPLIELRIYDDQWIQWVSLEILRSLASPESRACLSKIDERRLDPSVLDFFHEIQKTGERPGSEKAS